MNDALTQSLLLGAFALALVLAGRSVLHLALGSNRSRAQIRWAFVAAASAVAFVLAADAIGHINHGGDSAHSPLVRVLVCALAVLSFPLHSSFAALGLPARGSFPMGAVEGGFARMDEEEERRIGGLGGLS